MKKFEEALNNISSARHSYLGDDYVAVLKPKVLKQSVQHIKEHIESQDIAIKDYEAVLQDNRRLVRDIDVAINGDNAAAQASMCDILSQIKREGIKVRQAIDFDALLFAVSDDIKIKWGEETALRSQPLIGLILGNLKERGCLSPPEKSEGTSVADLTIKKLFSDTGRPLKAM